MPDTRSAAPDPGLAAPDTRASDAEREQIAERLREAVAEGRLDMLEFEERLDLTYKARTHGELVPLVRDLPAPGTTTDVVGQAGQPARGLAPETATGGWADRIGREPATSKGAFAFWGGFTRKGRWTVGRKFTAAVFQAGGDIDLREARFEDRDVVIRCFAIMGGMQVTVPPDMNVEVRGIGLMGGFGEARSSGDVEISPGSPRVIVTGFALMGGVGVERKATEAERRRLKEQRKREKLEKKAERKELDG
ncbi:DUF1707 SHOCT-like domain-containing protein [Streptomyces paludis]|uniref:DUF1707 SHOCT-like domain-containing protein n=1 Tax=Streptomyces paludis TaxID=2282738 RepID=UPI001E30D69D|nr:DUF1707 domain-containing protein [Streptomyces paludis]